LNAIGPTYPAHIAVSQAEIRLVADESANAASETIRLDQIRIEDAQQLEALQAKVASAIDLLA
jgi:hypothetical protein